MSSRRPHSRDRGKGWIAAVLLVALLLAGCRDDAGTSLSVGSDGGSVISADGALTLEIPAGALGADTEITVRALPAAEWPDELALVPVLGEVYELGPEGLAFSEPVTLIRRFDTDALALDHGVPLAFLVNSHADGRWSPLEKGSISVAGGEVVVSASLSHFSRQAAFGGGVTVALDPVAVQAPVNAAFVVAGALETQAGAALGLEHFWAYEGRYVEEMWVGGAGVIRRTGFAIFLLGADAELLDLRGPDAPLMRLDPGSRVEFEAQFTCLRAGRDDFGARARLRYPYAGPPAHLPEPTSRDEEARETAEEIARIFLEQPEARIEVAFDTGRAQCVDGAVPEGDERPPTRTGSRIDFRVVPAGEADVVIVVNPEHADRVRELLEEAPFHAEVVVTDENRGAPTEGAGAVPPRTDDPSERTPEAPVAGEPGAGLAVQPIRATFAQAARTTTYRAAFAQDAPGHLSYAWSAPDCGTYWIVDPLPGERGRVFDHQWHIEAAAGELVFAWYHPHPPCDPTTDHSDQTIELRVRSADGSVVFVCTYQGAATGTGPPCERLR